MTELITMGFNVEGCKRAVYHTQNLGKEEEEGGGGGGGGGGRGRGGGRGGGGGGGREF